MTILEIAFSYLKQAREEILKECPPPYEFPSADGHAYHVIEAAIDDLVRIQKQAIKDTV